MCKVTHIELEGIENQKQGKKQRVRPRDLHIQVMIYVRASDIGEMYNCPYELIETDQGDSPVTLTKSNLVCYNDMHHFYWLFF